MKARLGERTKRTKSQIDSAWMRCEREREGERKGRDRRILKDGRAEDGGAFSPVSGFFPRAPIELQ